MSVLVKRDAQATGTLPARPSGLKGKAVTSSTALRQRMRAAGGA